jgi:hypothetical protein
VDRRRGCLPPAADGELGTPKRLGAAAAAPSYQVEEGGQALTGPDPSGAPPSPRCSARVASDSAMTTSRTSRQLRPSAGLLVPLEGDTLRRHTSKLARADEGEGRLRSPLVRLRERRVPAQPRPARGARQDRPLAWRGVDPETTPSLAVAEEQPDASEVGSNAGSGDLGSPLRPSEWCSQARSTSGAGSIGGFRPVLRSTW